MPGRELIQRVGRCAESLPDAVARQPQEIADCLDSEREQAILHVRLESDRRQRHALTRGPLLARVSAHTVIP